MLSKQKTTLTPVFVWRANREQYAYSVYIYISLCTKGLVDVVVIFGRVNESI